MFHQIIGLRNGVNYFIFGLQSWIGMKQKAIEFSPFSYLSLFFIILLNLTCQTNNLKNIIYNTCPHF